MSVVERVYVHNILIGNDDGVRSTGIDALVRAAKFWGEVVVVAPQANQTATAKALSFSKPLRITESQTLSGYPAYGHNGFPADSVAIYDHLFGIPDVILSGINAGENASMHSIFTSGTCAVAIEGGLRNIPAFAFSIDVPEQYFHTQQLPFNLDNVAAKAVDIARHLYNASPEFWEQVIFVNINFPHAINESTKIKVVKPETYKYNNYLTERVDPSGKKYYWLWGHMRDDLDPSKDSHLVIHGNTITISPIVLVSHDGLEQEMNALLKSYTNGHM